MTMRSVDTLPKLSRMEQKILDELESGVLPKVVALRLSVDQRTVENYKSRMRKKCFDAAEFLKGMKEHQRILKLRISVRVESTGGRKV